jgi:hypothetical protein
MPFVSTDESNLLPGFAIRHPTQDQLAQFGASRQSLSPTGYYVCYQNKCPLSLHPLPSPISSPNEALTGSTWNSMEEPAQEPRNDLCFLHGTFTPVPPRCSTVSMPQTVLSECVPKQTPAHILSPAGGTVRTLQARAYTHASCRATLGWVAVARCESPALLVPRSVMYLGASWCFARVRYISRGYHPVPPLWYHPCPAS